MDEKINFKLPLYTTNDDVIEERKQKYLKEVGKCYANLPKLTKEEYMQIKEEFDNGNTQVLDVLMEKSLYFIVDTIANLYAKYDLDDMMPVEEALSLAIYNYNINLKKFDSLPPFYSAYTHNVVNFFVFFSLVRSKTQVYRHTEKYDFEMNYMPDIKDIIDKKECDDPKREMLRKEFLKDFIKASSVLTAKEKEVLYLKLGIETGQELTNNEVAQTLGISISNASDIYRRAIRHLREPYAEAILLKYKNADMSL